MSITIERITGAVFALLMLVFGLNKFLGFIAIDPPADEQAQQFLGTMFTTYLFQVVAVAEIVGAMLLLVPKTKFIGWIILLPIMFNIAAFHMAHDFVGNGIWLVPTALFLAISYFEKDRILSMVK